MKTTAENENNGNKFEEKTVRQRTYRSKSRNKKNKRFDISIKLNKAQKILLSFIVILLFVWMLFFSLNAIFDKEKNNILLEREKNHLNMLKSYPLPSEYRSLIESEAKEKNIDPAFILAIILNESSFKKTAESRVGARGLMQIMENTAQWISEKLKDDDIYTFEMMYDPQHNIRYGSWYLNFLAERFHGDPILVAAAYHAGQGEVANWLHNSSYSEDGISIKLEDMIEGATKNYVTKVIKSYEYYKGLYYTDLQEENKKIIEFDS